MVVEHLATPAVAPWKKRFRAARVWLPSVVALKHRRTVTVLPSAHSVSAPQNPNLGNFLNLTVLPKQPCLQPEVNTYLHCPFPSGVASHFPSFKHDFVDTEHLRPADWKVLIFLHFNKLKKSIAQKKCLWTLSLEGLKTPSTGNVL